MTAHGDAIKGRDGCRVPLPWTSLDATGDFGFSGPADHDAPHLPQPAWFAQFAVDVEEGDEASMLSFYRAALALRRALIVPTGDTSLAWDEANAGDVVAYQRPLADGRTLVSMTNFGATPVALPAGEVLIASAELVDGKLPQDASAWIACA